MHPPPPKTVSREVQTMPMEIMTISRSEKDIEEIRAVQVPELKKEVLPRMKDNAVLTESIEMSNPKESRVKVKSNTFMDYYNSQPVKAPSNILEKFIKRKK